MRIALLFLTTLLVGIFTYGQSSRLVEGDALSNGQQFRNYIKNPSAKTSASFGTAVSSATLTRDTDTADKVDGYASFLCDSSSQGGYCEFLTNAIQEGDKTGNCQASIIYKGDGSLYKVQVYDGTTAVSVSPVLLNSTDWTEAQRFNYPCGATRTVRVTQTEAGTAPALNVARINWSKATNIGSAVEATIAGESYWGGANATSNCYTAGSTPTACGTDSNIPGPTVVYSQYGTWATTDVDRFAQTITNLPPGNYEAEIGMPYGIVSSSGNCMMGMTDGTTSVMTNAATQGGNGSSGYVVIKGIFYYAANQATATFEPVVKSCGSASTQLYNASQAGDSRTYFRLKRYPASSQTVVPMLQSNYGWTDGGAMTITATTTAPTKPSSVTLDKVWYRRQGPDLILRYDYNQTNNSGASNGSGDYLFHIPAASGCTIDTNKVTADTTVWGWSTPSKVYTSVGSIDSQPGDGFATGGVTVYDSTKLRFVVVTSNNSSSNNIGLFSSGLNFFGQASGASFSANVKVPCVGWSENQNAPLLVGGVTNGSLGMTRLEAINVAANCAVTNVTTPGLFTLSSGSNIASGGCTIGYTGFSSAPACTIASVQSTSCRFTSAFPTSTSMVVDCGGSTTGASITCVGPR